MTKAPPVGSKRVPPDGPDSSAVMIVGEAPGKDEEAAGVPFVGKSGQLLNRYLERHGWEREDVYCTNLCQYRPKGNKFTNAIDTPQLRESLEELARDVQRVQPNVIIALGGWPMYYLTGDGGKTPGSGILKWRGSILRAHPQYALTKVIPTLHPAFVLRAWSYNPIFHFDLGKALEDAAFPELRYPVYDSIIDPDRDELYDLVNEAISSDWISVDIETFPNGTFSCVGFCGSDSKGVCVTFQRPDLHYLLKEMWESSTPKIFQFGTYDVSFMRYFYGWRVGGFYDARGYDTYIAAANLMPSFPRGLDFLTSIYTRFRYYKTERQVWKESGDMNILWEYNIKDIIATYQIAMGQMDELRERGMI